MPYFDPTALNLDRLFHDRGMFDSADDWQSAGFKIVRAHETRMLVAGHKSVPDILFKKYPKKSDKTWDEQLKNYERRIEGIRRIKAVIEAHQLRHVVAPQKWLLQLPARFSSHGRLSYILAVERCDILDKERSAQRYRDLSEDVLKDLVTVLFHFGGYDSSVKNVPVTKDDKVAFIDTDRWKQPKQEKLKERKYMKYLSEILPSKRLKFAANVWDNLFAARAPR